MLFTKKTIFPVSVGVILIAGAILMWIYMSYLSNPVLKKPDIGGHLKDNNLVVIVIDALRADHLGCYGYHRNTSPFIDSLAQKGLLFEQALSNSSFTKESVSVLFSGRLPSSGNSLGWGAKPSRRVKTMAVLFKEAGYKTGFFSNTNALDNPDFTRGFNETWFCKTAGGSRNGPKLSRRGGEFIKRCEGQKFMMYLHFLDPHTPYNPPQRFYLRFAERLYAAPLSLSNEVKLNCSLLIKEGFGPGEERFEDMVLRYDGEIALVDKSVELLFRVLKKHRLLDNTLVLITADHGEEFLEHRYVEHGWTLYNESLHVPLILWGPGMDRPKRFNPLVSIVDILPTLLQLMGISRPGGDFDGTSLFKYKEDGFYFTPPAKPYIAEVFLRGRNCIRAVIKDNWKYIGALKWLEPRERPRAIRDFKGSNRSKIPHPDVWGPVVREELYDLSTDPGEKHNLPHREKRRELGEIIDRYQNYCRLKGLKTGPRKRRPRPLSKEDIERLKSLGYIR